MRIVLFGLVLLVTACSTVGGAAFDVAQAYYQSTTAPSYRTVSLNPTYRYLEVQTGTASALLVLAEVDPSPGSGQFLETWASAQQQVLRTQSGFFMGASGIAQVPTQVQTTWVNNSASSAAFSFPLQGVHSLPIQWKPWPSSPVVVADTPLYKRARQVAGLQVQAWQGFAEQPQAVGNAHIQGLLPLTQIVATDPTTGQLVYGQFCMANNTCVEYLLRTAQRNL